MHYHGRGWAFLPCMIFFHLCIIGKTKRPPFCKVFIQCLNAINMCSREMKSFNCVKALFANCVIESGKSETKIFYFKRPYSIPNMLIRYPQQGCYLVSVLHFCTRFSCLHNMNLQFRFSLACSAGILSLLYDIEYIRMLYSFV